jgi:acyl-CoA thioesterase-1
MESMEYPCCTTGLLDNFHLRIDAKTRDGSEPPVLIVALGDSVTSGAGLPGHYFHEEVYHAQLKRLLQLRYPTCRFSVINAGDDGRDAPSGVTRLERDVLHHQPDLLLVAYGLNDATARGRKGIEQYGEALTSIVHRAREASAASVILLTPNMMPTRENLNVPLEYQGLGERFIRLQNEGVLAAYAEKVREIGGRHRVAVADIYRIWEDLCLDGVDTTAMLVNGLNHPDTEGHRLAAESIMSLIVAEETAALTQSV